MPELTTAIVTHSPRDDDELVRSLRGAGTRVIELPCVRTEPGDRDALARAVAELGPGDWLILTSAAGADALTGPIRARVAAVGPATRERLVKRGIRVDFTPSRANGAALARELPPGGAVLLARSDRALPDLPRILRERRFAVREVVSYRTVVGATGDLDAARAALSGGGPVEIHVSSPSALDGLLAALPRELVARATLVARGPTTLAALRDRAGDVRIRSADEEVPGGARG